MRQKVRVVWVLCVCGVLTLIAICNTFNCRFCFLLVMKKVKEAEPEELIPSGFVLSGLVPREHALPNVLF